MVLEVRTYLLGTLLVNNLEQMLGLAAVFPQDKRVSLFQPGLRVRQLLDRVHCYHLVLS